MLADARPLTGANGAAALNEKQTVQMIKESECDKQPTNEKQSITEVILYSKYYVERYETW